ncbi:MAG: 16S rRNA (guanine(527)-N(7))-methyltransferase RsmG [Candidatus Ozemobacteraceae bacterium]
MTFREHLVPLLTNVGIDVSQTTMDKFEELGSALLADPLYKSVSKIFEPADIAVKHFFDALLPLALPPAPWNNLTKKGRILDLGTGGGFPALPLALWFPVRPVFAIDAKGKSIDFVARMAAHLHIKNLEAVQGRAEEIGRLPAFREAIDLVVCRAVADVRVLVELCMPLVKVGGFLLLYKGPSLDEELLAARQAFHKLAIDDADLSVHRFEPPLVPFARGFVLIEKRRPTPDIYPRRNGVPSAQPL